MEKKMMAWKTKGMNRDLSVSAFNPEFAFENMNLRLATNDGNTMMSWVNERGTEEIENISVDITPWKGEDEDHDYDQEIKGLPIGTAVLKHQLVVFTTYENVNPASRVDRIYVLEMDGEAGLKGKKVFEGDLGFSVEAPLETLVSYEAEDVQKVYWTDGVKQPRMINIARPITSATMYNDTSFDFVQDLKLKEKVTVKKECGNGGSFPSGVVQYALTYYQKYGQESNIFYTTPLLYVSPADRGGRPDETVDNTFTISVSHVDENFDYLRIYSIQRTSINGVPIVKRVQDIKISEMESVTDDAVPTQESVYYKKTSYTDTGVNGNTVDPTELLYKGGESVVAGTIEQKDGTLFLGNLKIDRISDTQDLSGGVTVNGENHTRTFYPNKVTTGSYAYSSQLTAYDSNDSNKNSVPCAGFKNGDYYRCGVQYQYKTGKWSDPIFVDDVPISATPSANDDTITVPVMEGTVDAAKVNFLVENGYKKVRAVVVYPNYLDRVVVCQGVSNKALGKYISNGDGTSSLKSYQSSWFYRPNTNIVSTINGTQTPVNSGNLEYMSTDGNPANIRKVEIQGQFDDDQQSDRQNQFVITDDFATFNSPDIEFDDANYHLSMLEVKFRKVANASFTHTLSDIDIQTETPTIATSGSGFIHKRFDSDNSFGIIAGPFYQDYVVDDLDNKLGRLATERSYVGWMVYPWQRTGSLNNDIERPVNGGVRSAVLKKKVISNYRYAETEWNSSQLYDFSEMPQLFSSNETEILKIGDSLYQGNIDTLLAPDKADGLYFNFDGGDYGIPDDPKGREYDPETPNINTPFSSNDWWKTFSIEDPDHSSFEEGNLFCWFFSTDSWEKQEIQKLGEDYKELLLGKYPVRMKYKSTPHLVMTSSDTALTEATGTGISWSVLPILELVRPGDSADSFYRAEMFGGTSEDAKKANIWVPCGEPVSLGNGSADVKFEYSWGDTYYQRWECMKTYPFTPEDVNQIIEIGSFMLETHVNIDGRYDRNRGQLMNVSPQNFNLMNPVYSQLNNFFQYRIMGEDDYKRKEYPNQITWTKTKEAGADVDLWTNITLASILELDGDKGAITKLTRLNDNLLCFQDTGISRILYNEKVQVTTSSGVPLELANSDKVTGKIYLSDTIGCSNKWSMTTTPFGIYFMDSHDKSIQLFNGQLENLSLKGGMNSWCKQWMKGVEDKWSPYSGDMLNFAAYYDKLNQEVLWINNLKAFAYSEKFGTFTSFYNYEGASYLCNLDNTALWLTVYSDPDTHPVEHCKPWLHQKGKYCEFFGHKQPYWMTLVGNPEPQRDKTFTNLEFRACVEGDGVVTQSQQTQQFRFDLPFDELEVWDEYQHGKLKLKDMSGYSPMRHGGDVGTLNRKFRIWRCDVPRDNVDVDSETEAPMGITRFAKRPLNRMRNPWMYLKLMKNVPSEETDALPKVEVHDMMMSYFV